METKLTPKKLLLTGLVALVLGIVIVVNSDVVIPISIRLIGIALLIMGVVETISFFVNRSKTHEQFGVKAFGAIIAVIFGIVLLVNPHALQAFFMFILGAFVILLSIWQVATLINFSRAGAKVSAPYYIFSVLFALAGVVSMLFPIETSQWIVMFTGVWIAAFGFSQIVVALSIKVPKKESNTQIEEVPFEEVKSDK